MKVKVYKDSGFLIVAVLELEDEFAFYLYKGNEVIEKRPYTVSSAATFKLSEPGVYQAKVFQQSSDGEKARAWSDRVDVDIRDLDLDAVEIKVPLKSEEWVTWLDQLKDSEIDINEPWYILEPKRYTADSIMTLGWRISNYPGINPTQRIDWGAPGRENRSWGFHLHAWEFIDPVLKEYQETGAPKLLQWMFAAAKNWWNFAKTNTDESAMVWYDMSLSLRTPRLARLLVQLANSDEPERALELFEPMIKHVEMLLRGDSFNPNNNHGFFAAAASVELPRMMPFLSCSEFLAQLGEERMRTMVDRQFADDGGHLEHSPDYHRMLLGSFEKGLKAGLITEDETARRVRLAANVLGWMVQPDGHLVQFGDSPAFDVDAAGLRSVDSETDFILSDGREGTPNQNELCILPNSGYAFVRSPQPTRLGERIHSGYLAFQAGFHSRAHKHADDLTFTWFDKGREILVDAGRYGYEQLLPKDAPERELGFYYGAPERMYVESTIAHNTVQVNGRDIDRRNRKPYGSAVEKCTETDGRFILRGLAEHQSYVHERMLRFEPGQLLEVIDTLSPVDEGIEAIAWFNIDGDFEATIESNSILFRAPDDEFMIRVSSDSELVIPVRGQQSPMRGWRSKVDRELVPVWNFGYKQSCSSRSRQLVRFQIVERTNRG